MSRCGLDHYVQIESIVDLHVLKSEYFYPLVKCGSRQRDTTYKWVNIPYNLAVKSLH